MLTATGDPVGKPVRLAENLLVEPWPLVTELPPSPTPYRRSLANRFWWNCPVTRSQPPPPNRVTPWI
ncbi:MAG: hypothetical protein IPL78_14225 [Chloroflexi bacterium]|nr:hypothetical protein [Chloroflexota bacterium]